ncbi:hypothetical protein PYCC9005_001259 [Savitreella phatthalungensis]
MADKEAKLAAARKRAAELKAKKGQKSTTDEPESTADDTATMDDKSVEKTESAPADDAQTEKSTAADHEAELATLRNRVSELEHALAVSKKQVTELEETLKKTKDQVKSLEKDVKSAQDETEKLKKSTLNEQTSATDTSSSLQKDKDGLTSQLDSLQTKFDALELERDGLQMDLQALRDEAKTSSAKTKESQPADTNLELENRRLKSRITNLESLVAAMRGSVPVASTGAGAEDTSMQEISLERDTTADGSPYGAVTSPRFTNPPQPAIRDKDAIRAAMRHIQADLTRWYDKHAGEIIEV